MLKDFGEPCFIDFNMKKEKSLNFPFVGSLEDGEPFEYLLLSLDKNKVEIAILEWLVNRVSLHVGAAIDLHLPKNFSKNQFLKKTTQGQVSAHTHREDLSGEIYHITLNEEERDSIDLLPSFVEHLSSLELLKYLIKDAIFIKQGVRVYLKHLIPYFSRKVNYEFQDYQLIEKYFLNDIEQRIKKNEEKLTELLKLIESDLKDIEDIALFINLEDFREMLESEISLTLFHVMFDEQINKDKISWTHHAYGVVNYIHAIKNLEKRLYFNYNLTVILYLKSLEKSLP